MNRIRMTMLQLLLPLVLGAALLGSGMIAQAQAPAATAFPVIPVETLFRKSEYRSLTFSPDQKFMAALMPINSRFNLVIIDLEKRDAKRVTNFDKADVLSFWWASNDRLLFTTGDTQQFVANSGNGGLFAVNRDGSASRILIAPFGEAGRSGRRATSYLGRIKGNNEEVLVTANDRDQESDDIYRMNMFTGRKTLVSFDSPGNVARWVLDRDNTPRAAWQINSKTMKWAFYYRSDDKAPYKKLREWDPQLNEVVIPLSFDADGKTMFVASNIGRDTMAFFRFDPEANKLGELVYGDDRFDMYTLGLIGASGLGEGGNLRFSGREEDPGKVIGVTYQADRPKTVWFDEAIQKTQAMIDGALPPGNYNTWNPNQRRTLVFSRSDVDPGRYYIFDQDKKTLEETAVRPSSWIEPKQMRPMQYVSWSTPDGMKIDGYLTLPAEYKPGSPVPLILHPHGGPWAKDNWGYNPEVQFLANRGYAVLQPNFRGSVGYGTKHLKASYKTWGDAMIDDMISGVEWAIKEGYADKDRLAVYGASYGGYATLMSLVKRPDLFKWGVNYVGVTDMAVHQDTQPAQRFSDFGEYLAKVINGDQKADREMFERASPARHVAKIQAPVFHAYGGEDRNVDIENGKVIRSAFDKAGKPQEWMYVSGEAHGYRLDANVFDYYNRFDAFMKKYTPAAK